MKTIQDNTIFPQLLKKLKTKAGLESRVVAITK